MSFHSFAERRENGRNGKPRAPTPEVPKPEDATYIAIAQKFAEWIFAGAGGDPAQQFRMTPSMKKYACSRAAVAWIFSDDPSLGKARRRDERRQHPSANSFQQWAHCIAADYGKPVDSAYIEVARQEAKHWVFLYFNCERLPIKMVVMFDGPLIADASFEQWL